MPRAESIAQQGEETRQVILDAAIELFGTYGYRGCSLAQIAKRAGIVQSGVYHHFGTKEKLLDEALRTHYPVAVARADIEAIAAGETTFGAEIVRITKYNAGHPHLVRFFSAMSGEALTEDHPARQFFIDRYDSVRSTFTEAVLAGIRSDDDGDRARVTGLVTLAFAAMDGLQEQWLRNAAVDLLGGVRTIARQVEAEIDALRGTHSVDEPSEE